MQALSCTPNAGKGPKRWTSCGPNTSQQIHMCGVPDQDTLRLNNEIQVADIAAVWFGSSRSRHQHLVQPHRREVRARYLLGGELGLHRDKGQGEGCLRQHTRLGRWQLSSHGNRSGRGIEVAMRSRGCIIMQSAHKQVVSHS